MKEFKSMHNNDRAYWLCTDDMSYGETFITSLDSKYIGSDYIYMNADYEGTVQEYRQNIKHDETFARYCGEYYGYQNKFLLFPDLESLRDYLKHENEKAYKNIISNDKNIKEINDYIENRYTGKCIKVSYYNNHVKIEQYWIVEKFEDYGISTQIEGECYDFGCNDINKFYIHDHTINYKHDLFLLHFVIVDKEEIIKQYQKYSDEIMKKLNECDASLSANNTIETQAINGLSDKEFV